MAESSVICATDDQWGRELHLKENMTAKQLIVKNMITTLKHSPQQFNTSNEQLLLQDIKNPVATVVAKSYEEAAKELVETILAGKSRAASRRHMAVASLAVIISLILSVRLMVASC